MGATKSKLKYSQIKNEYGSVNEEFTGECSNINTCKSLTRLVSILKFHSINDNDDLLLQYMNKYKNLLNDYHHILYTHLNKVSNDHNTIALEHINKECMQSIHCSLNKCQHYQRNNRNRCKQKITNVDYDSELFTYTDILDSIHVYFVHSFDTGFRVKYAKNTSNNIDQNDENMDFNDNEMKFYRKEIMSRRQQIRDTVGDDRIEKTKFITDVSVEDSQESTFLDNIFDYLVQEKFTADEIRKFEMFLADNEYDSYSLQYDLLHESENQSNIKAYQNKFYGLIKTFLHQNSPDEYEKKAGSMDDIQYSFGQKFYYDDKHK
eukprot:457441_1